MRTVLAAALLLAGPAPGQTTELVSAGLGGGAGNGMSVAPAISADGRFVAFQSLAGDLVAGPSNGSFDVFVRDLASGATVLVSGTPGGVEGAGGSYVPALSADGRVVTFMSHASDLGPPDANPLFDVYARDLVLGATVLVSVDSAGVQPTTGQSSDPAVSPDGRYVAFESTATTLVPGDTNGWRDVFVRDLVAGTTVRASLGAGGVQAASFSDWPSISSGTGGAGGPRVAFDSPAANLVPGDTNGVGDVFVRDLAAATTVRASVASGGAQGDAQSRQGVLSADGRIVAFASEATNLVPGDANGATDVFVRDLAAGTTERVSVGPGGVEGDGDSAELFAYGPIAVSADGRFVAFESRATNLVLGDTNGASDVFLRDRLLGTTIRVSLSDAGAQATGDAISPAVSADGRRVAFETSGDGLVAADANGWSDVFLRDRGAASAFASFCAGDGSAGPCPCGNAGASGNGCENSAATGGARLEASGTASLAADSVVLTASGERPTALSIVLQGDRAIAPVSFGDGLRCAGGTLKRLDVRNAVAGTVVVPGAGDPSISARSAALGDPIPLGATRIHQVYYRDPSATFCPAPAGDAFNATGAVAVAWGG